MGQELLVLSLHLANDILPKTYNSKRRLENMTKSVSPLSLFKTARAQIKKNCCTYTKDAEAEELLQRSIALLAATQTHSAQTGEGGGPRPLGRHHRPSHSP